MPKLDRRSLLQGLGVVPATAMLPSLLGRKTWASTAIPTRLLVFHTQEGWLQSSPQVTGTETNFKLGELMSPLSGHTKHLLFLKGLDMKSNDLDPTLPGNAHYGGVTHALTGVNRKSPSLPSGPSFDFAIASAMNSPTPVTRFPYLSLGVADHDGGLGGEWAVSFGDEGVPLDFTSDAATAYARVFANFKSPAAATSITTDDSVSRQQQMVTDLANLDFASLAPRMSFEDKLKLDAHAQLLSDLQKRLYPANGPAFSFASAACAKPASFSAVDWTHSSAWGQRVGQQAALAAAAFACDLTRVVTIGVGDGEGLPSDLIAGYKGGDFKSSGFHDLVHQTAENGVQKDNAAALKPVKAYHKTHAAWFAQILNALRAIPESDGQTVLDHTIVLWCGQLASGSHDLHDLNWILAGGGGFKMNRFLQFSGSGTKLARSHNDLFITIANKMGVNISTFGNPAACTGPLENLVG